MDYIEGNTGFPIEVMQQQGFAKAHHIKLVLTKLSGVQASDTVLHSGSFEVTTSGWTTIALERAQGTATNETNVYPYFGDTNEVLVRSNSPIKSWADLKGKRIGILGGPSSDDYWVFRVETLKFFGFDPVKQSHLKSGAPPLLSAQLLSGKLDAIIIIDPFQSQLVATGKVRSIGTLGGLWRQRTGQYPLALTVIMNTDWANAHLQAAQNFIAAYKESVQYMKDHPGIWPALLKPDGITSPQAISLVRQHFAQGVITQWNSAYFQQQQSFLTVAHSLFKTVSGLPKTIPPGTFSMKYLPSSQGG